MPRETWDATLAAQKFLSCVYRVREKSGFGVGIQHLVEVLTGADTDKIRRWRHFELSTYGIGPEHNRVEWAAIGRELVRMGLLRQDPERFNIVEITPEGREALRSRQVVTLTRSISAPRVSRQKTGEISCDEGLFEELRRLRKQVAADREVPPYIVFSDVALRQMARDYPQTERDFARISGVGQKKLAEFGETFLGLIREFLGTHPRQIFADDSFSRRS